MAVDFAGILVAENGVVRLSQHRTHTKDYRLERFRTPSLSSFGGDVPEVKKKGMDENVALHCGWGRLIFGQTFQDHDELIHLFQQEEVGSRDLAIYTQDHHVLLTKAPHLLFVDPSDTYRLWLHNYRMPKKQRCSFRIRLMQGKEDAQQVNRIYRKCGMVEADVERMLENQRTSIFQYFVAIDPQDDAVIGTIMGVDHKEAFHDPDNGSSFWCLAVDPDCRARGMGRALVSSVAEYFLARGREYLDLSVLHDNRRAKRLYQALGFRRIAVYVVKRKNQINKDFYTGGPRE